ncbi:hypothetical protein ACFWIQ_36275 [Kitasatospora sp. NPDC127059]|uniref:hypothetical protein n=1 Tax=Kitasatospora sp. NPDC127059 TaxID=3347120 RepID=UPI00364C58D3
MTAIEVPGLGTVRSGTTNVVSAPISASVVSLMIRRGWEVQVSDGSGDARFRATRQIDDQHYLVVGRVSGGR